MKKKQAVSVYEYRCRRCNEVFTGTIEDLFSFLVGQMWNLNCLTNLEGEKANIEEAKEELKEDEGLLTQKPNLFNVHMCEDGGRGLSDLTGCEPAREVAINRKGSWRGKYRDLAKANFAGSLARQAFSSH